MGNIISISCECREFTAELTGATAQNGGNAICYCTDCRAFVHHLDKADNYLDEYGGSRLYQTQPHRVKIIKGQDKLAVLQLKDEGLYRWYVSCCDTPIGNSLGTPKFSFFAFLVNNFQNGKNEIGPVHFRYKSEHALKPIIEPSGSLLLYMWRTLFRTTALRLNGKWKDTPFFDYSTGKAITEPRVLNDEERNTAYRALSTILK